MSKEVLEHVFEPFYTTKESGSGLGLATIFGIVEQNMGAIEVSSEEGLGTTVRVYFPEHDTPADELVSHAVTEELPQGNETILLVEDQEEVRRVTARLLTNLGYDVHDYNDPQQAVRFSETNDDSINLLLTDVIMPSESGIELQERIRRLQPSIRVLYMSGYADDLISKHGLLDEGVNFLPKPFTIKMLAQKVRSVLDAEDG